MTTSRGTEGAATARRAVPRRRFLIVAGAAVGLGAVRGSMGSPSSGAGTRGARAHESDATGSRAPAAPAGVPSHGDPPEIRMPAVTEHGAKVPIVVAMDHPMEPGHHVALLSVVNDRDPIPSKGEFIFSPENGQAYLAFQARLDDGPSTVRADVQCSHGSRWAGAASVRVVDGAGGCGGSAPAVALDRRVARASGTARRDADVRPPVIRIPQLVRGERLEAGQIVDVQIVIRHPVHTGLERRGDAWTQVAEPFYLTEMDVFMGSRRVSRFAMTPALSDNPLVTFRLRPREASIIRVVLRNSAGARLEAEHPLRLT